MSATGRLSTETASLAKTIFILFEEKKNIGKKKGKKENQKAITLTGQTMIYQQYIRFKHNIYLEKVV